MHLSLADAVRTLSDGNAGSLFLGSARFATPESLADGIDTGALHLSTGLNVRAMCLARGSGIFAIIALARFLALDFEEYIRDIDDWQFFPNQSPPCLTPL